MRANPAPADTNSAFQVENQAWTVGVCPGLKYPADSVSVRANPFSGDSDLPPVLLAEGAVGRECLAVAHFIALIAPPHRLIVVNVIMLSLDETVKVRPAWLPFLEERPVERGAYSAKTRHV